MNDLIAAVILLTISVLIAKYKELNNVGDILYSAFRAFIQLLLLGYVIAQIFTWENKLAVIPAFILMNSFAAYTAMKRIKGCSAGYLYSFLSIGIGSSIPLLILFPLGLISTKLNVSIPIAGMIIGNTLNTHTIVVDRFKSEVSKNINIIEGMTAMGADLSKALKHSEVTAIKTGMMTILNNLRTVGLVLIPGITGGMLLAGISPIKAVIYQLIIMYLLLSANLLTSAASMNLLRRQAKNVVFCGLHDN